MRLRGATRQDDKNIKTLYRAAFPLRERPPYRLIRRRAEEGRARLLVAEEQSAFAGFLYLIEKDDLCYLYLLAVSETARGRGVGSEILKQLKEECAGKRLFLAREPLDENARNNDQRARRRSFYLRGGLSDLPLTLREASVVYDVMGAGGTVQPEEYRDMMRDFFGGGLAWLFDMWEK